jgi:hypothetical protein
MWRHLGTQAFVVVVLAGMLVVLGLAYVALYGVTEAVVGR